MKKPSRGEPAHPGKGDCQLQSDLYKDGEEADWPFVMLQRGGVWSSPSGS